MKSTGARHVATCCFGLPLVALACGAAGREPLAAEAPAAPVDVVIAAKAEVRDEPARPRDEPVITPAPAPEPEVEPVTLPKTWTTPLLPGLSFDDALHKARTSRDVVSRLASSAVGIGKSAPSPSVATGATVAAMLAKESSAKHWFVQTQSLADLASRMYAAAFRAPDATREGRIDAIAEAAELDEAIARAIDGAGLAVLPATWRADPAIASTFEDIAVGPTRRWTDEAHALSRQCVDTARDDGVVTDAARRCALLRDGGARKVAPKAASDAGAGCACSPGDPLCSASLGGWCASP